MQITTVPTEKGKTMADHKNCKYHEVCDYRNDIGECPDRCVQYKHKDEVRVVRCKDCKHMEVTPDKLRWCHVWNGINGMGDEGFCNYGERKYNDL
jgi:hypothetical protein